MRLICLRNTPALNADKVIQSKNGTKSCSAGNADSHLTTNVYAIQNKFKRLKRDSKATSVSSSLISELRFLPEKYRSRLIEAHEQGSFILRNACKPSEPLETALWVEEHRWFWKPKDVKFIVVAESHVYTSGKENKVKMKPERLTSNMPENAPLNFVKLVYCLGYGEPDILDEPKRIDNNAGTRQYSELFRRWMGFT